MNSRLELVIHGRVQNVCFRAGIKDRAQKLNLFGWVKNELDGTVKAVLEGDEKKLKQLLKYCYRGPSFANVLQIDEDWVEFKEEFSDFKIHY